VSVIAEVLIGPPRGFRNVGLGLPENMPPCQGFGVGGTLLGGGVLPGGGRLSGRKHFLFGERDPSRTAGEGLLCQREGRGKTGVRF